MFRICSTRTLLLIVFFRAAWNATIDEKVFVSLSVKRVHCDKTEERSVEIFIYIFILFHQTLVAIIHRTYIDVHIH